MTKPNLVLLHGALGSQQQLRPLAELLSSYFHVFTFNFEGHGGKASDSAFSMELFANNTIDFFRDNNLEQSNIFGYSMGGYVGLHVAKTHPNLVDKIVTLGTKFNWTKAAAENEVKMLNPVIIEKKVPKFAKMLEEIHAPNDWRIVLNKTAKMMMDLADGKKFTDADLQQIKHRILIGLGALDKMVSLEESKQAVNNLPNSQLKIIEGFQHPIEKNDIHLMSEFITDFLMKGA